MKKAFQNLPSPLQKQIALSLIGGIVSLLLFAVILIGFRDFHFSLPCLLLSAFLTINGVRLCYNGIMGSYMCLQGICEKIETSGIRKRIKGILLQLDGSTVKIPVRQGMKALSIGDTVTVYLSKKTPVYEQDGSYMISSYYALDLEKRGSRNECR